MFKCMSLTILYRIELLDVGLLEDNSLHSGGLDSITYYTITRNCVAITLVGIIFTFNAYTPRSAIFITSLTTASIR